MIFKEIHIDGFGIFNGFSLKTLGKGVNIILGNNEVGKSTLLKFLRFTLFGYPRFKEQRMSPLKGGNHGGRIKAISSPGKEVLFERTGDDRIRLLYNRQETQNQSQWFQLLGNASAELYNNVYAFSLDELVDLGSLDKSGVEDKIFSVGLGLGNTSIGEVESNIQTLVDNIYTHRGRVQLIPNILKDIESKKSRIQQIQENLPKYQCLTQEITHLKHDTSELDKQLEELRTEKNTLDNYLKCYDSFISVTKASEELKKLPELEDYPEKGIEQLDKLEEKEQEFNDEILELQTGTKDEKGIDELEEAIKAISFNSNLLKKEDTVEYLSKNLEKYKQTINDKNDDEQKIEEHELSIKQSIDKINAQWTEKNITKFTDLISHKSKIENFKKEFDEIEDNKKYLEAQLKVWRVKENQLNAKNIAIVTSLIFLIGSIPAFYYGLYILGGALLLIALILFVGKKYFVKESSHTKIQNQLKDLETDEESTKKEYENYLEKYLNLPQFLLVETTLDVFNTIEQLKTKIDERDKLKQKLENQRLPFIQEFENKANSLKEVLQDKKQEGNTEILVNQIIAAFDASKTKSQEEDNLQDELKRKNTGLNNSKSNLDQNQKKIKSLLNSINAENRQDLRKKYEENNKVKEHLDEKDAAIQTIDTIVGLNKADEVMEYLNANEKQEIESRFSELTSEIDIKVQESKEKNNELGGKKAEIERIEGESELAEVMTELETEKQKLQNTYKNWCSGKIALKFLTEVKAKYEREKQPEVIKNSSKYFNKITGDGYKRIRVSLDEKDVAVYYSQEASKKIGQLSRGTKEQLLVSLRLGFIEEYEKQSEPLPIIVDEVLVNFDPYRARQTAEILQEFGKDRQILIFTCHPETKDYFDSSTINIIQI